MAFIHETANVSFKYGSKAICNYLPNQPLGYWINAHDFNSHRLRTYRESRIVAKVIASERCAVESMPLCYVWELGFDWIKRILHDCYRRLMIAFADLVLTKMTGWREYWSLLGCRRLSDFRRSTEICHEIPYFPNQACSSHLRSSGLYNNERSLSVEKPFLVRSQIHSSKASIT